MAGKEILHEMASPASSRQKYRSIRTEESPYSNLTLFNGKEALILMGFISTVYFLTGPHAMAFCNLLTSLPMAYFSFRILVRNSTSTDGYKSVVFYWSVFGIFATIDPFCSEFLGYYVIKCSILLAIFYNVAQQNLEVFREVTGTNMESVQQYIRSISPIFDSDSFPLISPSPTTGGNGSCDYMDEYLNGLGTAVSINGIVFESLQSEMMDTQQNSVTSTVTDNSDEENNWNDKKCHGIDRVLTPFPGQVAADFDDYMDGRLCAGREISHFSIKGEDSLANVQLSESKCTVAMAFGDIITNPISLVELFPNVPKLVTVVNCSAENIMWALKCNALHRLGASPACGVIASGATMSIRLLCHESQFGNEDESLDKLAIDYVLVGSVRQYSPSFIQRTDKKRHLLRISYKQK